MGSVLFPGPLEVFSALMSSAFWAHATTDIGATLAKIIMALLFGSSTGIGIGMLVYRYKVVYESVTPALDFFRSMPVTALFPLFVMFFGIGYVTDVAMALWVCALYTALHASKGLHSTSEASLMVAKSLCKSGLQTLLKIRLPEALPSIFLGLRTAASISVVVITLAEMFVGTNIGIGRLLIDSAYSYEIPNMYAGILLLGVIGWVINKSITLTEKRIIHWQGK
jgi:NitT/TauT family transport system permease protein